VRLVLFDLDNTLIAGDSDHAWGEFLVEQQRVDADAYRARNDEFYRAYQAGELDMGAYLAFALEPLQRIPPAKLTELHDQFMAEKIAPMRLPGGHYHVHQPLYHPANRRRIGC